MPRPGSFCAAVVSATKKFYGTEVSSYDQEILTRYGNVLLESLHELGIQTLTAEGKPILSQREALAKTEGVKSTRCACADRPKQFTEQDVLSIIDQLASKLGL